MCFLLICFVLIANRVLKSVYTMDEPESSRHKQVNAEIDDQFALDGKDDVVDVKEGLASQTYDSLQMLTKEDELQMKFNSEDDVYTFLQCIR